MYSCQSTNVSARDLETLKEFKLMCPWALDKMEKWKVVDDNEIMVTLSDGSIILYDGYMKTFRSAPSYDKLIENCFPKDDSKWKREFCIRLNRTMKAKGYNQEDLAYDLNISQGTLSNYLTSVSIPNVLTLIKIARLLGCTQKELLRLMCYK